MIGVGMTALDVMSEKFHLTDTNDAAPQHKSSRVNLLDWDGKSTAGLLPPLESIEPDPAGVG